MSESGPKGFVQKINHDLTMTSKANPYWDERMTIQSNLKNPLDQPPVVTMCDKIVIMPYRRVLVDVSHLLKP